MAVIILPIIIYFVINNALPDFIYSYIEFNFIYSKYEGTNGGIIKNIGFFLTVTKLSTIIFVISIVNVIYRKIKKMELKNEVLMMLSLILTLILISVSGRQYLHYGIILIPCFILEITEILEYIVNLDNKKIKIFGIVLTLVLTVYIGIESIQKDMIEIEKWKGTKINEELVDYVKNNTNENDSILALGNSCNIYNLTGRKYNGKYFYQTPIILDDNLKEAFMAELEENKPNLIIYGGVYEDEQLKKLDELLNELKTKYTEKYKENKNYMDSNICLVNMFKVIDNMKDEGIYTRTITGTFTVWTLNEEYK